ncbi:MAG: F0F1 ATP synthase subunit A [Holosporaceae bacterium]|jgi:F-type H+-transporting ATPase subunit a|nr:F0F1 ATP synthase subunit A [Holosporaceae bacterium]
MLDPLHQFIIKPIFNIKIAGVDLSFTNSSFAVLVAVIMIYLLFSISIKGKKMIPDRMQALSEIAYYFIAGLIDENIGSKGQKYFPFVFSIFLFILFGNLVGMIPYMFTYTSHIIVTFTLAMIVFLFVTILGFVRHGLKFFRILAPEGVPTLLLPLLVPVELISYLSRPISLSIRLFANMMAGHTMMKVFAGFAVMLGMYGVAPIAVNAVLTGFEIAISMLQAYIFTILTCVYLNDAVYLH